MKLKCFLFGHKEDFNDSGFPVCKCGSHAYYDENEWLYGGFVWSITNPIFRYFYKFRSEKCNECNKFVMFLGVKLNPKKHKDCLPF